MADPLAESQLFIGLISGTSIDGIDAALVDFSGDSPHILCTHALPWSGLQDELRHLCQPGDNEIPRLADLDRRAGEHFAQTAMELLADAGLTPDQIAAIGSHGQTVRHQPPGNGQPGFSLQIGDPNIIAEVTGITTIADFRRRDMAAGGQGAPLAPAFHQAIFAKAGQTQIVANIGGISNITVLQGTDKVFGHDTGPGNTLLDAWCLKHQGTPFDRDGKWAVSGSVLPQLLHKLLQDPYFDTAHPKSTGPELFNLTWLDSALATLPAIPAPEDVQATLLALTAQTLVGDIKEHNPEQVYICGGGARNPALMAALQAQLPDSQLNTTEALGVLPEWVEAAAFAWLAQQTLNHLPGNAPQATGAARPVILGGIYQG